MKQLVFAKPGEKFVPNGQVIRDAVFGPAVQHVFRPLLLNGLPVGFLDNPGDRVWESEFVRDNPHQLLLDRKSTRLNSSHVKISYAVFCLKKKKINSVR